MFFFFFLLLICLLGFSGALHPLLKARSEYRQVFLEMGFQVRNYFFLREKVF